MVIKKWVHNGYRTALDGKGNDFDNSLSSHADNRKNHFIVLGEGDTHDINGSFGALEKKVIINFSKVKTKFWLQGKD